MRRRHCSLRRNLKRMRCKIIKAKTKAKRGDRNMNKKRKTKYNEDNNDENTQNDDDELDY